MQLFDILNVNLQIVSWDENIFKNFRRHLPSVLTKFCLFLVCPLRYNKGFWTAVIEGKKCVLLFNNLFIFLSLLLYFNFSEQIFDQMSGCVLLLAKGEHALHYLIEGGASGLPHYPVTATAIRHSKLSPTPSRKSLSMVIFTYLYCRQQLQLQPQIQLRPPR